MECCGQYKNIFNKLFSEEKLAIKVFMDSGTTATDKFRARLRFK